MKIYSTASDDVASRVARLVGLHHQDLQAAKVKIDLMFISSDSDKPGSPLKLHGVAALAIASIIATKARAAGRGDCEILIDEAAYEKLSAESKDALLDHELEHFKVAKDKHGIFRADAQDRPKLRMKHHDHDFGWFDCIAKRHGKHSLEVQHAKQFAKQCGQLYFEFPVARVAKERA